MIDQRTDPVSRLVRATPPLLAALGGDPSAITSDVAADLLALLDLAGAQIGLEETPPIRTLWDPKLSDAELDYVMPPTPERRATPPTSAAAVGANVTPALRPQVRSKVSPITTAARLADEIERARRLARAG